MDDEAEREALEAAKKASAAEATAARKAKDAGAAKEAKNARGRADYRLRTLGTVPNFGEMPAQTPAYVAFLARHFPSALGLSRPTRRDMPWEPDPNLLAVAELKARELRTDYLRSQVMNRRAKAKDLAEKHLHDLAPHLRGHTFERIATDLARALQQGGRAMGTPKKPHPEDAPMIDTPRVGTPAARLRALRRLDAARREAVAAGEPVPRTVAHFRAMERRRAEARRHAFSDLLSITRDALKARPGKG